MDVEWLNQAGSSEQMLIELFERGEFTKFLELSGMALQSWLIAYYRYNCHLNGWGTPQDLDWADKIIGKWFDVIEAAANAGDPRANYVLGCLYAQGRWVERNAERTTDCIWKAAIGSQAQALKIMALVKGDFSPQRVLAETLIQLAEEGAKRRRAAEEEAKRRREAEASWEEAHEVYHSISIQLDGVVFDDEKPAGEETADEEADAGSTEAPPGTESYKNLQEWFASLQLPGTEIPPSADRARGRMPDLHRANASFAAKLVKYVRDRYDGDAPRVYHAARINRKTYSAIVGNELRPVSKRTAVSFAFALELPRDEADDLLQSAGFALSPSILEDMVFAACLDAGIHDLDRVNRILEAHGARPFLLQKG